MIERAEDWLWSSLAWRGKGKRPPLLAKWPVPCPRNWLEHVNAPQTEVEVQALQRSIDRGTPFGDARWQRRVANRLGLEASLRPRGRPRKVEK